VARLVVACAPHPRRFKANMDGDQLLRSWYVFLFQLPALPELLLRCRDYAAIDAMLAQAGAGAGRGTGGAGGAAAAAPARGEAPLAAAYYKRELARPGALTAAIDYYRASFGAPSPAVRAALARRVAAPTLLVWAGADSALGPQLLRGVGAHVADLRVEVVPGASHWVQQSDAGAFNALVADFLAPLLA
jgi:pimeloyl-ACP methyl ester carboxylesterase